MVSVRSSSPLKPIREELETNFVVLVSLFAAVLSSTSVYSPVNKTLPYTVGAAWAAVIEAKAMAEAIAIFFIRISPQYPR